MSTLSVLLSPLIAGILACIIAALAFVLLKRTSRKIINGKGLPPGPFGNITPFLGYLPYMGDMPHLTLCKLAKKFGDAYTIRFGSYDIVVLNNPTLIKTCFKEPAYSGRPNHLLAMDITRHGITFATGKVANEQRRFALKTLRDLGFGKRSMENLIIEEVKELVDYFKSSPPTTEHQLTYLFGLSVINALWSILASRKFSITDPYAKRVYQMCIEGFIDPPVAGALWFLPTLAKLFPKASGYQSVVGATEELKILIGKVVQEHKRDLELGLVREEPDFVDNYLVRIAEEEDPSSSFYGDEGYNNLVHVLLDLFTAGSDTLNSSINFAIKYLCEDPVLQRRVQREIDSVLGKSRNFVTLDDRKNMPLLDAVLTETLRISSIVTNGILHSTTEDTTLVSNGTTYNIPKDTIIMPNLYWVHHNPVYWYQPGSFNPSRFLQGGGEAKKNYVMAFSTGKRVCIAEQMAQVEFFLFLGGLLANFEFEGVADSKVRGKCPPGVFGGIKTGLVLNVDGLKVRAKYRR